jgi:hypothetical protein
LWPTDIAVSPNHSYTFILESKVPGQAKRKNPIFQAPAAGTNFGRLLQRMKNEPRSFVIEEAGAPSAVLLSVQEYIRLAAPEPAILKLIGEQSKANATDKLISDEIDKEIKAVRARNRTKRK